MVQFKMDSQSKLQADPASHVVKNCDSQNVGFDSGNELYDFDGASAYDFGADLDFGVADSLEQLLHMAMAVAEALAVKVLN